MCAGSQAGPGSKATPTWSPDGTRIAYRAWEGGADSIVVMDAWRRKLRRHWPRPTRPRRTAREATLLVAGRHESHLPRPALCATCPLSSSSCRPTGRRRDEAAGAGSGEPILPIGRPTGSRSPSWGGMRPVASATTLSMRVRRCPGRRAPGTSDPCGCPASISPTPRETWWSPDGTELALADRRGGHRRGETRWLGAAGGCRNGVQSRMVARRANGSPSTVTVDPSEYFQDRPCTARTWVVDADGTDERRLDPLVEACAPPMQWSPDGTRLAESADRADTG